PQKKFSHDQATEFIASLNLPSKFENRSYQTSEFIECVRNRRLILLSPTGSGKSLLIYLLVRYFNQKTLIIEDRTSLIYQMFGDFKDYGFDSEKNCHTILSGREKESDKPIYISTWQSIYKLPKEWFSKFGVVIGDECHIFKADSLCSIMEKLVNCPNRIGVSGTLDGNLANEFVLQGLFGPIRKGPTTRKLINYGVLADILIRNVVLKYHIEDIQKVRKMNYQEEISFLVSHPYRNKFIRNLALSLKGNTLLLFQFVEKHGRILFDMIKQKASGTRKIFFIYSGVDGADRDSIRSIVEKEKDAIIIASLGTSSKGINIKNLHNIIYAHPFKGQIVTRQSIGRGLRRTDGKTKLNLFDIVDNLSYSNKNNSVRHNYVLRHFLKRVKIYNKEEFDYKNINVDAGVFYAVNNSVF